MKNAPKTQLPIETNRNRCKIVNGAFLSPMSIFFAGGTKTHRKRIWNTAKSVILLQSNVKGMVKMVIRRLSTYKITWRPIRSMDITGALVWQIKLSMSCLAGDGSCQPHLIKSMGPRHVNYLACRLRYCNAGGGRDHLLNAYKCPINLCKLHHQCERGLKVYLNTP